jgi:hypothetical protein
MKIFIVPIVVRGQEKELIFPTMAKTRYWSRTVLFHDDGINIKVAISPRNCERSSNISQKKLDSLVKETESFLRELSLAYLDSMFED